MQFPTLSHKKIFMTGGTGFWGKSLLDELSRGALPDTKFVILSRQPEHFLRAYPEFQNLKQLRWVAGDVKEFAFPKEKFDYIIHAATPAVTTLAPGAMREVILEGTRHVLNFAQYCGAQKLLFASSGAVYGPQPADMSKVSEDFPCHPSTEYGIAKLEAEKMCVNSGIYTLIARGFAFVGPRLNLDIHFAIGNFIRNGLNQENIVITGDGTPFRSYLYADDLIEWLLTILDRGVNGRPYNVGSPWGLSIADLAREVAKHFSPPPAVQILTSPQPGIPASRYVPDTRRAELELGLKLKTDLSSAIEKTINFYQQHT